MRMPLVITLSFLLCAPALAQDAKQAAALRLIDTMPMDEGRGDSARLCKVQADRAPGPRAMFEANPAHFQGLSPASAYWPEVEALHARYLADFCDLVKSTSLKQLYLQVFSNRMSLEELEAAAKFAATPAGLALQAANRVAGRMAMAYGVEEQNRNTAAAQERYGRAFQELLARFKAEPR